MYFKYVLVVHLKSGYPWSISFKIHFVTLGPFGNTSKGIGRETGRSQMYVRAYQAAGLIGKLMNAMFPTCPVN